MTRAPEPEPACDSSLARQTMPRECERPQPSPQHERVQRTGDWDRAVAGPDVVRRLCGDAVVTVVQTADFWRGDNASGR